MKNFGMTLKTLMTDRNLSAQDLATAIAVPMRSVLEWTNNNRFPRDPAVIKKLSEYFHCSTHFIMYGEEDPRSNVVDMINSAILHTGLYEITIRKKK